MTYKLNDIRNLRIDWKGDFIGNHSASIGFDSGDRRFHIWLIPSGAYSAPVDEIDKATFKTADVLYSNPIEPQRYGGKHTRTLDFNAPSHRKLRDYIVLHCRQTFGDLDSAVRLAALKYVLSRSKNAEQFSIDLATNIREAIGKAELPEMLSATLLALDDYWLIQLRSTFYSAKYPDANAYGASGSVSLKEAEQ